MGKTRQAQQELIKVLDKSFQTEKILRKLVRKKCPEVQKENVKKALRKLQERDEIVRDGNSYKISPKTSASSQSEGDSPVPVAELMRRKTAQSTRKAVSFAAPKVDLDEEISPVPVAELMRRKTAQSTRKAVSFAAPKVDLDEEIRRLEQELEEGSSSSDEPSDEDENSDEEVSKEPDVLSLSTLADDRIEKLPLNLLPAQRKRTLKSIDKDEDDDDMKEKKRGRIERVSGLEAAVREVLSGYAPRSAERLPFYCRHCAKQYETEEEFFEHKRTEFHKTAVEMEKRATYCKLCRKQLTSPAQMKEHLMSRPHKERLQQVRQRQQLAPSKDSKRQWT
jgi:hypothetical protein